LEKLPDPGFSLPPIALRISLELSLFMQKSPSS
jgi:hypothetical protein